MITREFNLYLHAGHSIPLVINANQYDHGEQWLFTLFNSDGTQYVPSSGAIVGIKSDNLGIINSGSVDSNGKIVINETQQMTAAVGKAVFELVIDEGTHGTANFVVLVEPKPGDNADLSESDISMIEQAIEAASSIKPYGSPLVASTVAGMTDHDKVYVYVGSETGYTSGNWYYWDGSAWASGGVYNSVAVQTDTTLTLSGAAADSAKVGQELSDLRSQISTLSAIPHEVKIAMDTMFHNMAVANDDVYSGEYATIHAWATAVNVVSISATFEQGENAIYATSSLDDLKPYLTVTATYDDGTEGELITYELSGTLSVGASVITVSAEDKTTTFNVDVSKGFLYTADKGLLSAQSYATLTNTTAFTESIENGALKIYSPSNSGEPSARYNFVQAGTEGYIEFTDFFKLKMEFNPVNTIVVSASNTTHYGSPQFVFNHGEAFAHFGFGTTSSSSKLRSFATSTATLTNCSTNTWHTLEFTIEDDTQTLKLDGTTIYSGQALLSSSGTAESKYLQVNTSKNGAINFSIKSLEVNYD